MRRTLRFCAAHDDGCSLKSPIFESRPAWQGGASKRPWHTAGNCQAPPQCSSMQAGSVQAVCKQTAPPLPSLPRCHSLPPSVFVGAHKAECGRRLCQTTSPPPAPSLCPSLLPSPSLSSSRPWPYSHSASHCLSLPSSHIISPLLSFSLSSLSFSILYTRTCALSPSPSPFVCMCVCVVREAIFRWCAEGGSQEGARRRRCARGGA